MSETEKVETMKVCKNCVHWRGEEEVPDNPWAARCDKIFRKTANTFCCGGHRFPTKEEKADLKERDRISTLIAEDCANYFKRLIKEEGEDKALDVMTNILDKKYSTKEEEEL